MFVDMRRLKKRYLTDTNYIDTFLLRVWRLCHNYSKIIRQDSEFCECAYLDTGDMSRKEISLALNQLFCCSMFVVFML